MRRQLWIRLATLIALITALSMILSHEVNLNNPQEVETATNVVVVSKRVLRVNPDIKTEVEKSNPKEGLDEERTITIPKRLMLAVAKSGKWAQKKVLQIIEVVAGRRAAGKAGMAMLNKIWFPLLVKQGMTPEKILEMARKQTDLTKKANMEQSAPVFASWLAKKQLN